jgi:hypothetical protein
MSWLTVSLDTGESDAVHKVLGFAAQKGPPPSEDLGIACQPVAE